MSIDKLLNRQLSDELLKERAAVVAEPEPINDSNRRSLTIFRFDQEYFALGSEFISRIIPIQKLHPIPHRAGSDASALFSVDGTVHVCVDLRRLLTGHKTISTTESSSGHIVVIKHQSSFSGFVADEVCYVQRISVRNLTSLPATSIRSEKLSAVGLFEWEGTLVSLLDGQSAMKAIGGAFQ